MYAIDRSINCTLRSVNLNFIPCCFCCLQVLAVVGHQEAESRFHRLLTCLSHPPSYTCVRASTHLASLEEIRHKLGEELKKVGSKRKLICLDLLLLFVIGRVVISTLLLFVIEAADVQLISRGALPPDSPTPTNPRRAPSSC